MPEKELSTMQTAAMWSITPRLAEARAEAEAFALGGIIRLWERRLGEHYSGVLNVPCGLGRHDDALRKQGFNVSGVDLNPDFIRLAQKAHPQWSYHYKVGDMRKLPFAKEACPAFDIVINLFTSIGYNGKAGDVMTLAEFRRVLKKGGLLIIETHNREPFKERLRQSFIDEPIEGFVRIVRHEVKDEVWTLHNTLLRKEKNGNLTKVGTKDTPVVLYSPEELSSICRRAEFEVLAIYGGYTINPIKPSDVNMMLVARKK
ncbi:MAG: class I SAM-dependent methyltransferase [Candidatus Micrarchaeales archaeon]|nr:class I SAM-dependent methyltransferase [Candidatus Micrarchaeales archaeon]